MIAVRVRKLAPKDVWSKRYTHIREFERLLVDEGTHLVKICLHVSKEEQGKRLQERLDTPEKRWKFRLGDLDDRKLWDDFTAAYEDTIRETSTDWAPWHVVPVRPQLGAQPVGRRDPGRRLRAARPAVPPPDPQLDGLQGDVIEPFSQVELRLAARNHGMPLEALRYPVTPAGLHYLLIHYDIPAVDPASFELAVGGRGRAAARPSLDDLRARPAVELEVTMECAGNGRALLPGPRPVSQPWLSEAVGTAAWRGTPLAPLLAEAGPPTARARSSSPGSTAASRAARSRTSSAASR